MTDLDRLDAALLAALTKNPRAGVVHIAAQLGVTRNTVQSRLRKLESSGALVGYRPELDLPALGLPLQAFVGVGLEQARLSQVIAELGRLPEVLEVHATTGREDLLVRMAAESQAAMLGQIEKLHAIPGVAHTTTTMALATPVAYRTQPLIDRITRDAGHGRSTPAPD